MFMNIVCHMPHLQGVTCVVGQSGGNDFCFDANFSFLYLFDVDVIGGEARHQQNNVCKR